MSEKKKGFTIPHVYIILMIVMLLVVVLSYVVPSGEYIRSVDPDTGRTIVDADSFQITERPVRITPIDFFGSMYEGAMRAAGIIMSLLIIAGPLELLQVTGTIESGISKLVKGLKGKESWVPPMLVMVFAILGNIGFQEGALPFYPIAVSIMVAIGYDKIAGVAAATLGIAAGFTAGALNIFTTGIAQEIVGLPLFSGLEFRLIGSFLFALMGAVYLSFYCKKIKTDPSKSFVAEEYIQQIESENSNNVEDFNWQRIISLLGLVIVISLQGYGSIKLGWGLREISSIYLLLTVLITLVFKINGSKACELFIAGSRKMLGAALTLALANAVMVLMEHSMIIDTAVNGLVKSFQGKSEITTILILYLSVLGSNLLVTSGSGKAAILMPILAPFAQIIGISQQLMVLIFQYGDGFSNYFWPTSGVLMAGLAMTGVDYKAYAKFAWKIILAFQIVAFIILVIASNINLGPF